MRVTKVPKKTEGEQFDSFSPAPALNNRICNSDEYPKKIAKNKTDPDDHAEGGQQPREPRTRRKRECVPD
jgi:hypothetical protein